MAEFFEDPSGRAGWHALTAELEHKKRRCPFALFLRKIRKRIFERKKIFAKINVSFFHIYRKIKRVLGEFSTNKIANLFSKHFSLFRGKFLVFKLFLWSVFYILVQCVPSVYRTYTLFFHTFSLFRKQLAFFFLAYFSISYLVILKKFLYFLENSWILVYRHLQTKYKTSYKILRLSKYKC